MIVMLADTGGRMGIARSVGSRAIARLVAERERATNRRFGTRLPGLDDAMLATCGPDRRALDETGRTVAF
jgi:hypothetical protein